MSTLFFSLAMTWVYPAEMPDYSQFHQHLIGEILRRARVAVGLSIRGLAAKSGVSPSHILRIESGEHDIRLSSLIKLASCVGLTAGLVLEQGIIINVGVYAKIIGATGMSGLLSTLPQAQRKDASRLIVFCATTASTVAYLLDSSNPEKIAGTIDFPGPKMKEAFAKFAKDLDPLSPQDRIALKQELEMEPVDFLSRFHLVTTEIAVEYLSYSGKSGKHWNYRPDFFRLLT